jgi:hypothetical protein
MGTEFEKLVFEAALRGLDKQEGLLEAMRSRAGVLLAASSVAASFLGQQAYLDPRTTSLVFIALAAFVVSIGASVFVLLPKKNLTFAPAGIEIYAGLYAARDDLAEIYRRLAYNLDHLWDSNDKEIGQISRAFTMASGALVVEILALVALLGDSLL